MKMLWMVAFLALVGCNDSNPDTSVLLVGDSITIGDGSPGNIGYAPYVEAQRPNTHHNADCPYFQDKTTGDTENAGNSTRVAACMSLWLSNGRYSFVHFNAGLHDVYVEHCRQGATAHEVELSDYLENLQVTLDAIRAYGAVPIFATTTPVEGRRNCHSDTDIVEYNAAAVQMMESQGVQVDDLYNAMFHHQDVYHLYHGIHFNDPGYQFLADVVVKILPPN